MVAERGRHLDRLVVDLDDVFDDGEDRMSDGGDGLGVDAQQMACRPSRYPEAAEGDRCGSESFGDGPVHGAIGPDADHPLDLVSVHRPVVAVGSDTSNVIY